MKMQFRTHRQGILLLVLLIAMAMPTVSPTGISVLFGGSPALDAVLSLALSSPGPDRDLRAYEVGPFAGTASHRSPAVVDDLTAAVHAWRPALESAARWSPRPLRSGAVALPVPGLDLGFVGFATAAVALSFLTCRPLAWSPGRMALLRAPPARR